MADALPPRPQKSRLFLGAALGLGAVLVLSSVAFGAYASAARSVDHTLEVRATLYGWTIAVLEVERTADAYVVTGQEAFLEPYRAATRRETVAASHLRALVSDNPEQLGNLDEADRAALAAVDELGVRVAAANTGRREKALADLGAPAGRKRVDEFRALANVIDTTEARLLVERRAAAASRGLLAALGALLFTIASCALLAVAWRREGAHQRFVETLAKDARRRLRALSDLAAALSEARTRADVAAVVADHGMRAAGADTCTLYELDEAGTALELIADRGVAPSVLQKIRRISETSGNPSALETVRSGKAVWAESAADYAALYPGLAKMEAEGPRANAFWSAPLVAEGRSLGLLGVGFYEPRKFSNDERAFVRTLTQHCAQALLRATGREREDEARRWLATTLRSIGDAVIATDAEGRVTFLNPVAEVLTGWSEADARGRPLDEVFCIVSEATRALVESPVTKVLREGAVVGLANHTLLRSRRGVETAIDDSAAPIRGEGDKTLGVVLVFRDATLDKRRRAQSEFLSKAGEALASSIDYRATLATVARFAVPALADFCVVDVIEPDATAPRQVAVAHADEAKVRFARELGERYPPDPNARAGVAEVIRSGKSELYTEIPAAMLEAGARDAEHLKLLRELRLQSAMVVPLRVRERTLGAITFVYADSGRRYTEGDLAFAEDFARRAAMAIENALALKEKEDARAHERALRADAELASRAKDDFLATVSHELRTPLNAILGWTVTLRRKNPPEDIDRALAVVERNARLQTKLIEDVLDISRIISGKLALNLGPTNVAEVVSAAVETVTPAAEAKEIKIGFVTSNPTLTITADADRLQQIVWNVLSNAVKFTPKGGAVDVRSEIDGVDVAITVRDSGEGIRREVLPLVFEPFHQADASTTRRHGGLGLGLAIVKQLVSAHGGTVAAESGGDGRGATFTVRLPARPVPAVSATARSGPASVRGVLAHEAPKLDGLRVLVVDDEEDARELVGEVLRDRGAEVFLAASAAEALETLVRLRPDVVVSDIGLPETDGLTLIRKIRALDPDQGGRTPAVALTAYARGEDARRAFAAGFQTHLAKPIEPARLTTVVANLGGRSLDAG